MEIPDTPRTRAFVGISLLILGGAFTYSYFQTSRPTKTPKSPSSYSEFELATLIRATGDRCQQPAVVTPTPIPNGTNYLVACYGNTGTYEIAIAANTPPQIKKLTIK